MTRQEVAEVCVAAKNVAETDIAVVTVRIDADGELKMSAYGEPFALNFIYKTISKAWADYDDRLGNVCVMTTRFR